MPLRSLLGPQTERYVYEKFIFSEIYTYLVRRGEVGGKGGKFVNQTLKIVLKVRLFCPFRPSPTGVSVDF